MVIDVAQGTSVHASVDATGARANAGSIAPSLSPDGRFIAFASRATDIVERDGAPHRCEAGYAKTIEPCRNLYLRDLERNRTILVTERRATP